MLGLAAAFAALALSAPLVLEADLRAEAIGGSSPTGPAGEPEARADLELTPALHLSSEDRAERFRLRYGPRLYMRLADTTNAAPLVLHQVEGTARATPVHGLELDLRFNGRAGDIDYTAASLGTPGITPGTVPPADRLRTLGGDVAAGGGFRFERGSRLLLEARAGYERPEGEVGGTEFPRQARAGGSIGYELRAGPLDVLAAEVLADVVDFDPGSHFDTAGARAGWRGRLSRAAEAEARLGLLVIGSRGGDTTVAPLLDAAISLRALRGGGDSLTLRLGIAFDGYADPIRARYDPRASASAGVAATFGRSVSAEVVASFYTLATPAPSTAEVVGALGALAAIDPRAPALVIIPDDTFLAVRAPVTWKATPDTTFELGARFFARGPHLAAEDFGFRQVGLLFYLAAVFSVSSDERGPSP